MTEQQKIPILSISGTASFACLCSDCPRICCTTEWDIFVSQRNYDHVMALPDPELKLLAKKHMRIVESPGPAKYAKITSDRPDKLCPFLDDKQLCSLQLRHGHSILSFTCQSYPRQLIHWDDHYELSASLSCPAIARMLANKNPAEFDLDALPQPFSTRHTISSVQILKQDPHSLAEYIAPIREAAIDLLQMRQFSITLRLLLVGFFCQRLEKKRAAGETQNILAFVDQFLSLAAAGKLNANLEAIPVSENMYQAILPTLFRHLFGQLHKDGTNLISSSFTGLGMPAEALEAVLARKPIDINIQEVYANYRESCAKSCDVFYEANAHLWENYFIHYVMFHFFPFEYLFEPGKMRELGPFHSFFSMVDGYVQLRFLLAGKAREKGFMNEDLFIETISEFATLTFHSDFLSRSSELFQAANMGDLSYAAQLVIN